MRILVTSTSGAGHVHPIVPLSQALADTGHEILWATGPEGCDRVARSGFAVTPAGMSSRTRMKEFLATTPEFSELPPRARRALAFAGLFGRVAAPRMRDDLGAVFDEYRPDVVVHDIAELAAVPMATARSIPHVTVAFSGAIPAPALERAVEESAPVWSAEGLEVPADLGFADHLYLHPFPAAFEPAPPGPHVQTVRPMRVDGARVDDAPPDWVVDLGHRRPAMYATFGTELGPRAPWADLLAAIAGVDADVIATTGPGLDRDALGPVPGNVRVETYVPQGVLLDRVSLVVSHAGAGTVLAAVGRGLPQLCLPCAADQFENADAVFRSGAGLALESDDRGPESIAAAIARILEDTALRDHARAVAVELEAMPDPAEHVATIEDIVSS